MEWSGIVTSARRIVNRVLSTSNRFCVVLPDPGDPGIDGPGVFFSAGGDKDIDVLDDDLVAEKDKCDIDGAGHGARATKDHEPDGKFRPDGNGVRQGTKEVVQPRVGLNRETGRSFGESMES